MIVVLAAKTLRVEKSKTKKTFKIVWKRPVKLTKIVINYFQNNFKNNCLKDQTFVNRLHLY